MPIVDKRIQEWRWSLQQRDVFKPEDLDELESHLKDEIGLLQKAGLTEEESFWVAARRVGEGKELVEEYRKINPGMIWKQRIFWMLGGYFLINLFLLLNDIAQTAYLFLVPWGTVQSFFWGADLRIPVIPCILGILFFGIVYFWLTRRRSQFSHGLQPIHVNRRWKAIGIVMLVAALSASMVACWVWLTLFIRTISPQLLAQISATNSLFALIFKLLIAMIFVRLAIGFLLQGEKGETESE